MPPLFRMSNREGLVSDPTDEELMARYQSGDEAAFEEIYSRYAKRIYGFLLRRLGHPDDCAELFQETFLRVHRSRSLYRPEMPFKAWVYTIANNLVRDRVRAKARSGAFRALNEEENSEGNWIVEGVTPDGGDKLLSFKEAFAKLTDDQKEAVVLSRFQGLRYEEIGRVMGRSTEAVNQLIQRAMHHLRECINES